MKYPRASFLGLTWVGWLNVLLLQWFFLRLQGVLDEHEDGSTADYWTLIFPVVPLTGWWSRYVPHKHGILFLGEEPPLEKDETSCPDRDDQTHCDHWWDDEGPCCGCGEDQIRLLLQETIRRRREGREEREEAE